MKLFPRVFLMLSLSLCSFQFSNAQTMFDPINIPDATAFPNQIITGKSEGMGLLQFIVRDELRDPYINPAKVYKSRQSSITAAPINRSLWFNSTEEVRSNGKTLGHADQNYKYRTHILPIAGTFHTGNFYTGGYASYLNYKENFESVTEQNNRTISNTDETIFKGSEVTLHTGLFLGDNTTVGASYNRARLENDLINNIITGKPDIDQKADLMKAGLGSKLGDIQLYLLFSGFRSKQKAQGGNLAIGTADEEGVTLQSEIHIPVSELVVLAARVGAGRSKTDKEEIRVLSSGNSAMVFPLKQSGNRTSLQAGIGIRYTTSSLELAAESEYQPFWITSTSEIDETKSETFRGLWRLGVGVNASLSKTVSWQTGLSYNFSKANISSSIQEYSSNTTQYTIVNPVHSSSVFITTGVTCQVSKHTSLGYSFIYNNLSAIFSSAFSTFSRNQMFAPVTNRLSLQYKF